MKVESRNIDINKYIILNNLNNNFMVSPKLFMVILETELGKSYNNIRKLCDNVKITITKEEIEEYANECISIGKKVHAMKEKERKANNESESISEETKEACDRFFDMMLQKQYGYDSFMTEYFTKYIDILKQKIANFFELIDLLNCLTLSDEQKEKLTFLINDLDITLNENGILLSDVIRIVKPMIYNIDSLFELEKRANDKETYIKFKMTRDQIYFDGLNENELYPSVDFQIKNLNVENYKWAVALTEKQKEKLWKNYNETVKYISKILNF